MYTLDKIKIRLVKDINKALGEKAVTGSDLVFPPQANYGDLSLPCFTAAKKAKKTPVELAGWLVSHIPAKGYVAGIKAVGPYVNFTFAADKLAASVIKEIETGKNEYGRNKDGGKGKVVIEYSNANTHKEYHIGHLRNISYGDAVNRILNANGYKSIPVSYINDFGIHVAKTLWAYLEFYKKEKLPENLGFFLGKVYVRSVKELERNALGRELVGFIMKKIESRQGEEYELWRKTRQWSIDEFARIYGELGVVFKDIFYESEFIDRGKELVANLYEKRFLKKSDGAIIADLESYSLGALLFLRTDGTALYPVADIPLAEEKMKRYKPAKSIYVVDIRQSLYFRQLFKVLELLGVKADMSHLGYEFVTLPEGMMSSRSGNVITYRELRDRIFERAKKETAERHPDWPAEKLEKTAMNLSVAAMKFEMIKVSAQQTITFDIDSALRFEGFTAAYLQYTYARIRSILKKAGQEKSKQKADYRRLAEPKEQALILQMARYPDIVKKAGTNYDPAEIAKYLYELASQLNDYYHSSPVLKAEEEIRQVRISLVTAVSQVLRNGLDLLGIEVMEEM